MKEAEQIQRKVRFYAAIVAGRDRNGNAIVFPAEQVLSDINSLSFGAGGRDFVKGDGEVLRVWVDSVNPSNLRARFGRIRMQDLPQVAEGGDISQIPLSEHAGLAEMIHLSFFPGGIVGCVENGFGPRVSQFAHYVTDRIPGFGMVLRFEPLVKDDILSEVRKYRQVRVLRLRIHPAAIASIERADRTLGKALTQLEHRDNPDSIEIVLRWKGEGGPLDMFKNLARLARPRRGAANDDFTALSIRGRRDDEDRMSELDVLGDKLVRVVAIAKAPGRSKAPDDAAAFAAIDETYNALKEELERAIALIPDEVPPDE